VQLHTIRAAGFTAAVDACAQDGGQICFISLLGSQQAVRALWARLVKGETAYLGEDELAAAYPCCWSARPGARGASTAVGCHPARPTSLASGVESRIPTADHRQLGGAQELGREDHQVIAQSGR
jgi:hypothetical protein